MGAWRRIGKAAACAVLVLAGARSEASTVMEPIARLTLEGGYDSNVLYDGRSSDRTARVSPEVGLRMRDHLWDARLSYRGEWINYERLAPGGIWNHGGALALAARPTRRLELGGALRGSRAFDPVGLAQEGVFRTGRQSALIIAGSGRAEYRWSRRVDVAATLSERVVRFEDDSGGAMHAATAEALWRMQRRLSVGGAYAVGVFQTLDPDGDGLAFSHGLRARARWRASRRFAVEASAGPALWIETRRPRRSSGAADADDGDSAIVPEAAVQVLGSSRWWDLRASLAHGLSIGSTARPGLVDAVEFGTARRFGRRWALHGAGGIWRSGAIPSGDGAVTGYALIGEGSMRVADNLRLALGATHFARLTDASPESRRTTMGIRVAWELPAR
jgi:hypothetical protein